MTKYMFAAVGIVLGAIVHQMFGATIPLMIAACLGLYVCIKIKENMNKKEKDDKDRADAPHWHG